MKILSLIIITFFATTVHTQEVPFSIEELKHFRSFEGNQISFMYDDVVGEYIYKTSTTKQLQMTNAQLKLRSYIKLIKNEDEDEYCFSDVHFEFELFRQGRGSVYNRLEILIGFTTNIRKGDAIKYEFDLSPDILGYSSIEGEVINEIITKSDEMKRPVTFNFFNDKDQLGSMMISYARFNQKFGGILDTQANLLAKYIRCEQ